MDPWFWVGLFVALLGYGIALGIYLLDYNKRFQAGRDLASERRFLRLRYWLGRSIAVGAVAALALAWHKNEVDDERSSQLNDLQGKAAAQSSQLTDVQRKINLVADVVGAPAADVVRVVGGLKKDFEDQKRTIEEQTAKIEEMKRQAAPRTISAREGAAIKRVLEAAPKGLVSIVLPTPDGETFAYGLQLEALFKAAGWRVNRQYGAGLPPQFFVLHVTRNDIPQNHPLFAVSSAFKAAGFEYKVMVQDGNVEAESVQVFVPRKPQNQAARLSGQPSP